MSSPLRDSATTVDVISTATSKELSVGSVSPGARTASTRANSRNGTPEATSPALNHCVRNTFVEIPVGRGLSMDESYQEREVGSCPASGLRAPPGLLQFPRMPSVEACEVPTSWPRTLSGEGLEEWFNGFGRSPMLPAVWPRTMSGDALEAIFEAAAPAPRPYNAAACGGMPPAPTMTSCLVAMPPMPPPVEQAPGIELRQKLELFELLAEDQVLGTTECPTVGSKDHRYGTCKPCAFLHRKGCTNGAECVFCHVCAPGEKKRRQKDKKEALRAQRLQSL